MLNLRDLPDMQDEYRERGLIDAPSTYDDALLATEQQIVAALEQGVEPDSKEARDHAQAMDALHDETLKFGRELMELGFNVDTRSARGIFEVASGFFKHAIDAKNSKRDAQLKALKIALDQRKVELDEKSASGDVGKTMEADVLVTVDRNELIRKARERIKAEEKK